MKFAAPYCSVFHNCFNYWQITRKRNRMHMYPPPPHTHTLQCPYKALLEPVQSVLKFAVPCGLVSRQQSHKSHIICNKRQITTKSNRLYSTVAY